MEKIDLTNFKSVDLKCNHFFSGAVVYVKGKFA